MEDLILESSAEKGYLLERWCSPPFMALRMNTIKRLFLGETDVFMTSSLIASPD